MLGFGPHLIFDGYRCRRPRLDDLASLYRLLDELPDRIHMTKIMPPYVFRHAEAERPGTAVASRSPAAGLSGFVLIAESHISVHTFPALGFVNVDIFSCENFDVEDALATLRQAFDPRRIEWKLLDRGREFPKRIGASRAEVGRERRAVARGLGLEVLR